MKFGELGLGELGFGEIGLNLAYYLLFASTTASTLKVIKDSVSCFFLSCRNLRCIFTFKLLNFCKYGDLTSF